jgi:hypothetical protein
VRPDARADDGVTVVTQKNRPARPGKVPVNKRRPRQSAREALAAERAKLTIWQLHELGFHPYLDAQGALLIADTAGDRRDFSQYLPIAEVFDAIVDGLDEDPGLLDS